MSTSDSDYSIDWLASDEEDYDSLSGDTQPAPSSTTSSPLRDSPRIRRCSGATRADGDGPQRERTASVAAVATGLETAGASVRGFTCVARDEASMALWTDARGAAAQERHRPNKRPRSPEYRGYCEKTLPQDPEKVPFTQTCAELQRYVQPLSSILRGLQAGRYSERLSSFQESVAMDRIQRIMGVLQHPNRGERFLSTLMKIEQMLQSWFPHVRASLAPAAPTPGRTPAKRQKKHQTSPSPAPPSSLCSCDVNHTSRTGGGPCSAAGLKWLHVAPICSHKTSGPTLGPHAASPPAPARCHLEATQDNAVSSSTDTQTGPPTSRQGPPPFQIRSPCLERLLQAKDSIIAPRTVEEPSWSS